MLASAASSLCPWSPDELPCGGSRLSGFPMNPFPATGGTRPPQSISEDWPGVPEKVDAAMAGRIYISGSAPRSSLTKRTKSKSKRRNRKRYRSQRGRGGGGSGHSPKSHRKSRSIWLSLFSSEESDLGAYNYDYALDWLAPPKCEPIQSVYFFSGGRSPCHP